MAAPDTAGHHHFFALWGHAQALQPLVVLVLEDIAADEHLPEAAGALLEEQLEGLSEQVLPAGVKAELQFGDLAVSGPQPAHPRHGLLAVGVQQHQAGLLALIQEVIHTPVEQLPQLGRQGGLLELPHRQGGSAIQRQQFQLRRQGQIEGLLGRFPAPEGFVAELLEALLPQQTQASAVGAGAGGDPTGGIRAPLDCGPHQGGLDGHPPRFPRFEAGLAAAQVLDLPAAAAAVEPLADHQPQRCLGVPEGHEGFRGQRRTGCEALQQLLRSLQQQGALQQGQEVGEAGILQKGQLPSPQRLHLKTGLSG